MLDPVAVERAEADLDAFIDRRAKDRSKANELAEFWRASEQRHRERRRRENAAAWYSHHCLMRELHASIAAEHEARALALLEEPEAGV